MQRQSIAQLSVVGLILSIWYVATVIYTVPISEDDARPSADDKSPEMPKKVTMTRSGDLPDFAAIVDVNEKKQAFFSYIEPFIDYENSSLAKKRQRIEKLRSQELRKKDRRWLQDLVVRYRVNGVVSDGAGVDSKVFDQLLLRVDQIPASLVMAQAANESGWGTSRFAREGNNLFGQWCFVEGCGIVPGSRPDGATYEVRRFESVGGSVTGYFHNINSQPSYHNLRELRRNFRLVGRGHEAGEWLAEGLLAYSSRAEEYVREIQSMIRSNTLDRYDVGILEN